MSDVTLDKNYVAINSSDEIMRPCEGDKSLVNLFITRVANKVS